MFDLFLNIEYFVFGCIGIMDLIISHTCLIMGPCLWTSSRQVNTLLALWLFLMLLNALNFTKCYFCLGMLYLGPFLSLLLPALLAIPVPVWPKQWQVSLSEKLSCPFLPPGIDLMFFLGVSLALWCCPQSCWVAFTYLGHLSDFHRMAHV